MARTVHVNLKPLDRWSKVIARDLRHGGNGPIRDGLRQWAVRYRGFIRRRFDQHSKGRGDWPALSPSTIRSRRKGFRSQGRRRSTAATAILRQRGGLAAGGVAMLRDTGTLFAALSPQFRNKPGQLQQDIPFGVRVGFGGPARHRSGKATIAQIAAWHDEGAGNLPQRQIIVDPDKPTVGAMQRDMQKAVNQLLLDSQDAGGDT